MEVQHKTEGFDVITVEVVVLGQHSSCCCSRAAAPPPPLPFWCPVSLFSGYLPYHWDVEPPQHWQAHLTAACMALVGTTIPWHRTQWWPQGF